MSNNTGQSNDRSLRPQVANVVGALELLWPVPLIAVGVLGLQGRLIAGTALIIALVPWLVRVAVLRRPTRRTFVGRALVLLVAGALVGMGVTYDPSLSWPAMLTLLGSVGLFFAIVNADTAARRVGSALVLIAVLAAVCYIGHAALPLDRVVTNWLSYLGQRMPSTMPDLSFLTPQANALASFVEGALLLSLAVTIQARGARRVAWGLAVTLLASGLLISRSRGSWIGIAVAMGIWALMLVPSRRLRLIVGGLGGTGGVLGTYALLRLTPVGQSIAARLLETAGSRFILYRNSFHLLGDYIFTGIGPGETFAMVYSKYQLLIRVPFLTYAHNLPLAVALGYGLLGLISLAWLLLEFYRFVALAVGRGLNARSSPLFFAAWLGLTASFVHGLTDSPQFSSSRWTMPMLFALLGLAIAAGSPAFEPAERQHDDESVLTRHRRQKQVLIAGVIITVIIAVAAFRQPLISAWYANAGTVCHTRADLSPELEAATREENATRAAQFYDRALDLDPSQPVANRRLGLMAMDRRDFNGAVSYLERAYPQEPDNQATLKALGLAYTWTGRVNSAEVLLRQLDDQGELIEELNVWCWWWSTQEEEELSAHACEMSRRLLEAR